MNFQCWKSMVMLTPLEETLVFISQPFTNLLVLLVYAAGQHLTKGWKLQESGLLPFVYPTISVHNEHVINQKEKYVQICISNLFPYLSLQHQHHLDSYRRPISLHSIFEFWISEFISNLEKNRVQNQLDFFSSLNLISTACVACKNQFRNQIDFSVF